MTKNQFWMKLDQLTKKKDKSNILSDCAEIMRQAYEEDLGLIIGCIHELQDPESVHQLYLAMTNSKPEPVANRYLLCYTSKEQAKRDKLLPEGFEVISVRAVVDNALNKKVIGGLIFNQADEAHSLLLPKAFLTESDADTLEAMGDMLRIAARVYREHPESEA